MRRSAEFGLLGPLYVRTGGVTLPVTAAGQRVVLAALAVRAGHVVSFGELSAALWGDDPPRGARVAVRNQVSRLRHRLGRAGGCVVTRDPGYVLDAAAGDVDLLAFSQLCREGGAAARAGAWPRAAGLLDGALRLWRGEPLADVPSPALRDEHAPAAEALRLQAIEWQIEAGLHTGRHDELVTELEGLVREHPLRERFRAQLMLALYRSGRKGDALAAYRSARQTLVSELGVEPAPDLRELHQQILAADPRLLPGPQATPASPQGAAPALAAREPVPGPPAPRQLPAAPRHFVGRQDELHELTRLRTSTGPSDGAMAIAALSGTAGVGKTALAVHWAHLAAEHFPDGQLYVNLQGFDPVEKPVAPAEAVRTLLEALQVPPERIPASVQACTGAYRALLAGKRMLVLLDNVRDAEQVRPLLPGDAGCMVLITSRRELTGLVATEGAHPLKLDLLDDAGAHALLAARLGAARLAAEPEAAAGLVRLCARLPLALVIAAARIAARPRFRLDAFTRELTDTQQRLDALDGGDPAGSVRAVFACSLDSLPAPLAHLFALLGLHPGPDITITAAASLAAAPPPWARHALRELADAHLITQHTPGRFALHDLLRTYAAEQARGRVSQAARREAAGRLLGGYVATSCAAALLLNPARGLPSLPVPAVPAGVSPDALDGHQQALAWYAAEHRSLVAAAGQAAAGGFDTEACLLAWALADFLSRQGRWRDWVTVQQAAMTAATRLGDHALQARTERGLGRAYTELGALPDALRHLRRALELDQHQGDLAGQASSHLALARVAECQADHHQALSHAEQAAALLRPAGGPADQALALHGVGWYHAKLGHHREAVSSCEEALRLFQRTQDRRGEATVFDSLGYIHHQLGRYDQASACYRTSLAILTGLGDRANIARALTHLGDTLYATASPGDARACWQQALAILDDLQSPDAARIRAKLGQLPAPGAGPSTPPDQLSRPGRGRRPSRGHGCHRNGSAHREDERGPR